MKAVERKMTCPLCLEDKEVVTSHLIPKAMYDYCRTPDSEPVVMTSRVVMQTSRVGRLDGARGTPF